ncbi:MAG TPA: hypothetical protein VHL30_03635 [Chlamydiales bacterium]|jgi:hypothetical protein|nr:hypothetical protein [Chlamydiales bacterium]
MSIEIASDETASVGGILGGYLSFEEEDHAFAELNGRKRELSVLRKTNEFLHAFPCKNQRAFSLDNKSVVHKCSTSTLLRPMEAGGSVEGKLVIDWGNPEGPSWSGSISAEAHDDNGNYAKVEVKQDSDGKGRAEVSAGHKEENK